MLGTRACAFGRASGAATGAGGGAGAGAGAGAGMLDAKIVPTELSDSFEYPLSCDASDELVIDEVDIAEFS